ncbi:unnamed protein product, partial [Rotaria magnacalcarata]
TRSGLSNDIFFLDCETEIFKIIKLRFEIGLDFRLHDKIDVNLPLTLTARISSFREEVVSLIVQEAFEKAQAKDPSRISLIIAHRLSTIRSCNLIFAIDRGHRVEIGSHAQLIQLRGAYCALFAQSNLQSQ